MVHLHPFSSSTSKLIDWIACMHAWTVLFNVYIPFMSGIFLLVVYRPCSCSLLLPLEKKLFTEITSFRRDEIRWDRKTNKRFRLGSWVFISYSSGCCPRGCFLRSKKKKQFSQILMVNMVNAHQTIQSNDEMKLQRTMIRKCRKTIFPNRFEKAVNECDSELHPFVAKAFV